MPFSQSEARARNRALQEQGLKLCPKAECPAGGTPQPFEMFFKKASRSDGLSGWCKACWTKTTTENKRAYAQTEHGGAKLRAQYERRQESGRMAEAKERHRLSGKAAERAKAYDQTPEGRAARSRYKAGNLAKVQARRAVNNAVLTGKIPPANTLACLSCGGSARDYHHHLGYAKAHHLDVRPYCKRCHEATHHQSQEELLDDPLSDQP